MSVLPGPGAVAAPADVTARLTADLPRRATALVAAARRARRGDDPESIHDLRVAARRLTAALALWRPLLRDGSRRRALRSLRRLRDRLGLTREREVMRVMLERRLEGREVAVRDAAQGLAARLARRVERGRARAARPVVARRVARIVAAIERALAPLAERAVGRPGWLERARGIVQERASAAHRALAQGLAHGDDAPLHQARLAVKRWRYAGECLQAATGVAEHDDTRVRELQQRLGHIHDCAQLRDALAGAATSAASHGQGAQADALAALSAELERERERTVQRLRRRVVTPAAASPDD